MEKRERNLSKKCHLKWSGQKLDQVISKSNCFSIAAAAEHSLNLGEFGIPYQSSQKKHRHILPFHSTNKIDKRQRLAGTSGILIRIFNDTHHRKRAEKRTKRAEKEAKFIVWKNEKLSST